MAAIYIVKEARSSSALTQAQITTVCLRICKSVGDECNILLPPSNFAVIPGRSWKWRKQKEMNERGTKENCIKSLNVDFIF